MMRQSKSKHFIEKHSCLLGQKLPNKAGVFIGSTKNIHWFKSVCPRQTAQIFIGFIADQHLQKVKETQSFLRNSQLLNS